MENLENQLHLIDEAKFHIIESHYKIASILSSEGLLFQGRVGVGKKSKNPQFEAQTLNAIKHYKATIEFADELLVLFSSINNEELTPKHQYYKISTLRNKSYACSYFDLHDDALKCFDEIEAINPSDYSNLLAKSVALEKKGKYSLALESAKKAMMFLREYISIEQHSLEELKSLEYIKYLLHIQIGKNFEHQGDFIEALDSYNEALNCEEDNLKATYAISLLHHKRGNILLAKELMQQILPPNPTDDTINFYEVIISLADLNYNYNNFVDALALYERALKISSLNEYETFETQTKMGYALYNQERYDEALKVLRQTPTLEAQQKVATILLEQGVCKEDPIILKSIPSHEQVQQCIKETVDLIAQECITVAAKE